MLTTTQSQQIDRYLAELADALGELPEPVSDDVIAGVREHIQAALASRPTVADADIDEVLRALGDPLTIAAEAVGDAGPATATPDAGRRTEPASQRGWVPGAVVVTLLLSPLVLPFFGSFGAILLLFLLMTGWALLWISPLWSLGERLAGTFLLPATGVVFFWFTFTTSGGVETCTSSGSTSDGSYTETCTGGDAALTPLAAVAILAVVVGAGIATTVVVYRNGRRRAAQAAQSFSTGA